ncbi:MAG: ABC transporter substrate-binding protein [Arachnia sp.]
MPIRSTALRAAVLLPLVTALSACAATTPTPTPTTAPGTDTPSAAPPAGPVTATDLTGRAVTVEKPAERVVCLDGSCIDALAELGLEPVASVQFDQVTSPLFFGPGVSTVALGGTFFEPDLEGVIAAEPDLVIGSGGVHAEIENALGGIPLYLNKLATPEAAVTNLRNIAELTGRQEQAETAIERYETTLAAYQPGSRPLSALSMYGGATDDIGIDALDSATGRIIAQYTDYPWPGANEGDSGFLEIGIETILEQDPDYVWVLDFGFDPSAPPLLDQLAAEPLWKQLTAVKEGRVYAADAAWWGTTSGTRGQQGVLDTVLPTMYPEEFPRPLSGLTLGR